MPSTANPGPNLFVIGAPKCGTTSLYEYLRRHPQIFFPAMEGEKYWIAKEPSYFCTDMGMSPMVSIKDRQEYLSLYAGSEHYKYRGDASACALRSQTAPALIKEFCPEARIAISLRPPVDMMHSHHKALLRDSWENIQDFHEALAASEDRDKGLRLPPNTPVPRCLNYFTVSRFAPQVERWLQTFDRSAIKIILLEDLVARPAETWKGLLEFLQVDTAFQPDFRVFNEAPGKSRAEKWVRNVYWHPRVHPWASALVPYAVRRRFLSAVRANSDAGRGDARDEVLREQSREDVQRLGALIERDLSHWM